MNILVIGGSKNIGYHAAVRFLEHGHTVTFLLRNPTVFDQDSSIQRFLTSTPPLAHLVQGDALIKSDVERARTDAISHSSSGQIDIVLFTVGATPSQGSFHITKGILLSPPNLVTQAVMNVLCLPAQSSPLKIVVVTSTGITRKSKAALPFPIRALYGYLIAAPHRDKRGAERLLAHVAGWDWDAKEIGEISDDVLDSAGKWKETPGLPAPGSLKDVLIVRAATLTDGECVADRVKNKPTAKEPYRVNIINRRGRTG
ncbi:hypothetical protein H0H93_005093 [Arthromyces matolae]|nr:hypothetical protein H0H93_005093 [Arthromyces matolae]